MTVRTTIDKVAFAMHAEHVRRTREDEGIVRPPWSEAPAIVRYMWTTLARVAVDALKGVTPCAIEEAGGLWVNTQPSTLTFDRSGATHALLGNFLLMLTAIDAEDQDVYPPCPECGDQSPNHTEDHTNKPKLTLIK